MNNILFNLAIEPFGTGIGEYYRYVIIYYPADMSKKVI
jgi:hypothetical protein